MRPNKVRLAPEPANDAPQSVGPRRIRTEPLTSAWRACKRVLLEHRPVSLSHRLVQRLGSRRYVDRRNERDGKDLLEHNSNHRVSSRVREASSQIDVLP